MCYSHYISIHHAHADILAGCQLYPFGHSGHGHGEDGGQRCTPRLCHSYPPWPRAECAPRRHCSSWHTTPVHAPSSPLTITHGWYGPLTPLTEPSHTHIYNTCKPANTHIFLQNTIFRLLKDKELTHWRWKEKWRNKERSSKVCVCLCVWVCGQISEIPITFLSSLHED